MAYQIHRKANISEDLEFFCKEDKLTIHVEINPDAIIREYRVNENAIIAARLELKKSAGEIDTSMYEAFGKAVIGLFNVVFSKEDTEKILEFYEGNYTEMMGDVMPFITEVVAPAIEKIVTEKRAEYANNHKFNRNMCRKLGI